MIVFPIPPMSPHGVNTLHLMDPIVTRKSCSAILIRPFYSVMPLQCLPVVLLQKESQFGTFLPSACCSLAFFAISLAWVSVNRGLISYFTITLIHLFLYPFEFYLMSNCKILLKKLLSLFPIGKVYGIHSISYFIIVQIMAGIFQTTGWPGVVTLVGRWFGKSKRGLIFGIWNSHTSIGNILGTVIAAHYVENDWYLFGWPY